MRACENCAARMPLFEPRKRQPNGELWCADCVRGNDSGRRVTSSTTIEAALEVLEAAGYEVTGGIMDYYDVIVHHRGDEGALSEYGDADLNKAVAKATEFWAKDGYDKPASVQVVNRGTNSVFWRNGEAQEDGRFYSKLLLTPLDYQGTKLASKALPFHIVAHDSGDGATIFHCPFCGSGQVLGGFDGTVECEFCHTNFTVQVQPELPAMPQTVDGNPFPIPGMPGTPADPDAPPTQTPPGGPQGAPNAAPGAAQVPQEADQDKDVPPFLRQQGSRYYLTAEGVALDEESFMRHLAIRHATDRDGVLAQVRASRAR